MYICALEIIFTPISMMKRRALSIAVCLIAVCATIWAQPKVYVTREISAESLIKIYKALGVKAEGRVAVKWTATAWHIPLR